MIGQVAHRTSYSQYALSIPGVTTSLQSPPLWETPAVGLSHYVIYGVARKP